MDISVVIPAHNEEKFIEACLDALIRYSKGRYSEIIVVDNASDDRTAELARRDTVRVVREDHKGLSNARERGRKEASGEFIAFIDADCRLGEGWFELAQEAFRDHPDVVCISGPVRYFDAPVWLDLLLQGLWWFAAPLTYRAVGYMVCGGHFVVRRNALEAIGGFDPTVEFYGEDTQIARRLATRGKVLFRMDFVIQTSARRFLAEGLLRVCLTYAINYVWPVLLGRPFSFHHRDIR